MALECEGIIGRWFLASIMWFISSNWQLWGGVNLSPPSGIVEAPISLKLRRAELFVQAISWNRSIANVR
jgi:hypothetical protein